MEIYIFFIFVTVVFGIFSSSRSNTNRGSRTTSTRPVSDNQSFTIPRPQHAPAVEVVSENASDIALVRKAINDSKNIEFMYCKPRETIFKKRVVRPSQILNVDHEYDFGSTICVRGYCYLRKADRTFAFKRMQQLSIQ